MTISKISQELDPEYQKDLHKTLLGYELHEKSVDELLETCGGLLEGGGETKPGEVSSLTCLQFICAFTMFMFIDLGELASIDSPDMLLMEPGEETNLEKRLLSKLVGNKIDLEDLEVRDHFHLVTKRWRYKVKRNDLYKVYCRYCRALGKRPLSLKSFTRQFRTYISWFDIRLEVICVSGEGLAPYDEIYFIQFLRTEYILDANISDIRF